MHLKADARRTLLICVLLAGVTLIAYLPLFQNDFVKYDDRQYVLENAHVRGGVTWTNVKWAFQTGYASNWHPLTWISHMFDMQLFGFKPAGHHFTNLLFHVANTLLLFLLLQRRTGAAWRSAFVAAFFALHPLHVESVAWVAERKDVLSAFFGLLCLIAYVKYTEKREDRAETGESRKPKAEKRKWIAWYLLTLCLFALGLMSKPMLVTWPFVMLLLDFWPLHRCKPNTERWKLNPFLLWEKLPFFLLSIASSVVTFLVQREGHAVAMAEKLPSGARLANAMVSYLKYLGKTIWPTNLAIYYPHPAIQGPRSHDLPEWQVLVAIAILVAISVSAIAGSKQRPWMATGWFWYLGTLVPVIGIVQVGGQAMADRYTYIPLVGIFVCAVWATADYLDRHLPGKPAMVTAGVLAAAGCLITTQKQVHYWRNNRRVFEHALAVTKNNPVAHYGIGLDAGEEGDYSLATKHFRAALEILPSYAEVYYSLGYLLATQGRTEEAIAQYRSALRIKPWHALAHNGLGAMLWKLEKRTEAFDQYTEALRYNPELVEAHYNLGIGLAAEARFVEAAQHFTEALHLKPGHFDALMGLAESLARQGKLVEAETQMQEVTRLFPTNTAARINLAALLRVNGKRGEAITQYRETLRLDPGYASAHCDLGTLLLEMGQIVEAESHLAQAAKLKPDYVEAVSGLGRALAMQGKFAEATTHFSEVVRLSPTNVEAQVNLGNSLVVAGQTNEAAAFFANALKLDAGLARRKAQAGRVLLEGGQLEAAVASLTVANYLNPNDANTQQDLGLAFARLGKPEEALPHFELAVRLRPDAQAYYNFALAQVMRQKPAEAVAAYEQAVRLKPDWAEALNDLAWLRATSSQTELRNGADAVRLAERACMGDNGKQARFLGTLAAAYAEAGRYQEAVKTAENAIGLATAAGQLDLAEKNRQLLNIYRHGKAPHEAVDEGH